MSELPPTLLGCCPFPALTLLLLLTLFTLDFFFVWEPRLGLKNKIFYQQQQQKQPNHRRGKKIPNKFENS
jgi:hypothetical protein